MTEPQRLRLPEVSTKEDVDRVQAFRRQFIGASSDTFASKARDLLSDATDADIEIENRGTGGLLMPSQNFGSRFMDAKKLVEPSIHIHRISALVGKIASGRLLNDTENRLIGSRGIKQVIRGRGRKNAEQLVAGAGTTPLDLYFSSRRLEFQLDDAYGTVVAGLGLLALHGVQSKAAKYAVDLSHKTRLWGRQIAELAADTEHTGHELIIPRRKIHINILNTVDKMIGSKARQRLSQDEKERLENVLELYRHWVETMKPFAEDINISNILIEDIVNKAVQPVEHIQEPKSEAPMLEAESDERGTPDEPVAPDITTELESPELPTESLPDAEIIEIQEHLKLINDCLAILDRDWFSKRKIKEANLHNFTQSMVNGVNNKDVTFTAMAAQDIWQPTGLLLKAARLLNDHGFQTARERLYGDASVQAALLHDAKHISKQIKVPSSTMANQQTIDEVIDGIKQRWTEYEQLINDRWPDAVPLDTNKLKALLFDSPEPATEVNDLAVRLGLVEVAKQLDWVVLPEGHFGSIHNVILSLYPSEQIDRIDWRRLEDLVKIRDYYGGEMWRSKDRTLGNTKPYFVVVANIAGKTFAIAENPQYANATYIVREDTALGTWQEVLDLPRPYASQVGAHQLTHRKPEKHLQRIIDKVQDLLTDKAA